MSPGGLTVYHYRKLYTILQCRHTPVSLGGCSSVRIGTLLAKKSITEANISGFNTDHSTSSSVCS